MNSSPAQVPDFRTISAVDMAEGIRSGTWSSLSIVRAHIDWIQQINGDLNAIVADRYDRALDEAKAVDDAVREGRSDELGPFAGVPCTIKECFAVEEMPHTAGVVARMGEVAGEDADAVRILREAGFVILGVSNTSELCIWMESVNKVYGRTANPYDFSRTAGGSSGGEGALVGSGGSPVGLGSDVGGSIRMPAYFNGVFGHKCSSFLISNTGQFPDAKGEGAAFLSSGPLCRKARDLEPIVELLAEREMTPLEWDEKWESLRVWVPEKKSITWTSASVFRTVEETASAMAQKGATVERFSLPAFRKSVEIWSSMMHEGNIEKFGDLLLEGKGFELTRKFAAWSVGRGPHTFATLITLLGERIVPLVPWEDVGKNVSAGIALREELDAMLGNADILLFPSHAFRARKHNIPLFPPFQWGNTAIFNVLGLPVTQVPTGLDENGIPCGVQVVGGSGEDRLTMAVARQLEAMLGGWTPPPILEDSLGQE